MERLVYIFIPFYDELKSITLIFLILTRARVGTISPFTWALLIFSFQSAEPIYLHVIRPILKPYVSTLDAVLSFIHNLGDFILLLLSLPFNAAISWWYGSSTDEDQSGLTEADSESVRSYGDEQPAASNRRLDYRGRHDTRGAPAANGHNPYPRGASRETGRSSDTLLSRFYAPSAASTQRHEIWHPPPSSREDIDEDQVDYPGNVPPVTMPDPRVVSVAVDDWSTYPPIPSAYPPTPVHPSQFNMPEPVHPSQFSIIHEEGTAGTVANNDQDDGARQGFGRSLLPPREPLNPGSDGDLSDEMKNPGVQIQETRYVTSSDGDDDMEDYETEEDSFDVTFQTPKHRRILRAVPMGREVSNISIVTEATAASSVHSEATGLTTDHYGSSLRTTTITASRSTSTGSSSAAGVKRPLPNLKIGVRPRIRTTDHRSPRKVGPTRGTGRFTALPRPASVKLRRGGTASEDTLDDEDLRDGDVFQGDNALLARKRRRVVSVPITGQTVASRVPIRDTRSVSQSSEPRPAQNSRNSRVARPVATKTSLRNINPRTTKGTATSSGFTASPRKPHQPKRRAAPTFRP